MCGACTPLSHLVWYFIEYGESYSFTFTDYYLPSIFFPLNTRSSFCMVELADFAESHLSVSMGGHKECDLVSAVFL
jgi:hypothetical protein